MYKVEHTLKQIEANGGIKKEETKFYFEQYNLDKLNGVALEKSEARAILIMSHLRLIGHCLKKMKMSTFDDDLFSLGKLGLIRAVDNFDINKNIEFSTYAVKCISRLFVRYLNSSNAKKRSDVILLSLNDPVYTSKDSAKILTLEDIIDDDENLVETSLNDIVDKENQIKLKKVFNHLKPSEQIVLKHFLGLFGAEKMKQTEIAKKLSLTNNFVHIIYENGKNKLRILLSDYESLTFEEKLIYNEAITIQFENVKLENIAEFRNIPIPNLTKDELFILINQIKEQHGNDCLREFINNLNEFESSLIIKYFGLFGERRFLSQDIANQLNLRKSTVLNYIRNAKGKLKRIILKSNLVIKTQEEVL